MAEEKKIALIPGSRVQANLAALLAIAALSQGSPFVPKLWKSAEVDPFASTRNGKIPAAVMKRRKDRARKRKLAKKLGGFVWHAPLNRVSALPESPRAAQRRTKFGRR